jgi:hypothetical protein
MAGSKNRAVDGTGAEMPNVAPGQARGIFWGIYANVRPVNPKICSKISKITFLGPIAWAGPAIYGTGSAFLHGTMYIVQYGTQASYIHRSLLAHVPFAILL